MGDRAGAFDGSCGPDRRRRREVWSTAGAVVMVLLAGCGVDTNETAVERGESLGSERVARIAEEPQDAPISADTTGAPSAATRSAPEGQSEESPEQSVSGSDPGPPASTRSRTAESPAAVPGFQRRSSVWLPPADDDVSARLATVAVRAELVATLTSAVDLAVRPGDPALYVVEHAGRVRRILDGRTSVVADVRDRLEGHRDEQGLTGLEFSADGEFAWTNETSPDGATTIRESPGLDDGTFDLARQRTVIDVGGPPGLNHNAGDLLLAPDGTLLVTLGDGDAGAPDDAGRRRPASDPSRSAHDPTTLRGSILRIRPTPGDPEPYAIPSDNPFAAGAITAPDGTLVDGRPEVWSWGVRNPWKIHLDEVDNTLWIADVGGDAAEEVNAVVAPGGALPGGALDFGWSGLEGTERRNDDVVPVLDPPVDPVLAYPHEGVRCAISGGAVYRGDAIPVLRGGYVFGDFCEGSVWLFDPHVGTARSLLGVDAVDPIVGLAAIRVGPDGELYALSWFGEVYRLVPG